MNEYEKFLNTKAFKDVAKAMEAEYAYTCINPNSPQEDRDLAWMENAALQRLKEKLEQKARK